MGSFPETYNDNDPGIPALWSAAVRCLLSYFEKIAHMSVV